MSNPLHFQTNHPNIVHTHKRENHNTNHNLQHEPNHPLKPDSYKSEKNLDNITVTDGQNGHGQNNQSDDDSNQEETKSNSEYFTNTVEEPIYGRSSEYFDAIDIEADNIDKIHTQETSLKDDIHHIMDVHHGITSFFSHSEEDRNEISNLMIQLSKIDKTSNEDQMNNTITLFMKNINDKNKNKLFLNAIFQLTKLCVDNKNNTTGIQEKYITLFTNICSVCNHALEHECFNINSKITAVTNILLESRCAILTLKALSIDHTETLENKKAKNELYLLKFLLEKIKKGFATPEQLMEYTELAEKSILAPSAISEGFGESLEVTISAETKGLHVDNTEGLIGTPIMFLHKIYFAEEPIKFHLKLESYIELLAPPRSHIAKLLPQPKYHKNDLREIHQEIKSIFKELNKANANQTAMKDRYKACLNRLNQEIENGFIDPEILTLITGKVKIQSQTFRGTLPSLLEILADTFEQIQPINSSITLEENFQETTNTIINKCYKLEQNPRYTSMEVAKCVQEAYKHTDWESKIAASSTVHKVLHIINQSLCKENEKQLHKEIFLNKISTIEALKKHRSHMSWLVAGAGALGIGCAVGDSLDINTTTSFIFDTFNTAFTFTGLTLIGHTPHEFRGTSTNERSIAEIIIRDKKKQNNNQLLISTFINQYLDGNSHDHDSKTLEDVINSFIEENILASDDDFKKYVESSIFEFSIKHKNCKEKHTAQPFIFILIDQTNNEEQQKLLLKTYYNHTLYKNNSNHGIEYNEAKFNKLLTTKHLNLNQGMLNFCKILAIIAHTSNIDPQIATNMSEALTRTLIYAKKDKLSNWHILVNKELKVNILIKFAITADSFALWLCAVAFLTPIVTPVGIIFITIGLRLVRIWLHRKCEIHDKAILEQAIRNAEQMQIHYNLNQEIRGSIDEYYLDNSIRDSITNWNKNAFNSSDEYKNGDYPTHDIHESTTYYDAREFNESLYYEAHNDHKSDILLDTEEKTHIGNLEHNLMPNTLTYQQRYQQRRVEDIIHKNTHHNHNTALDTHEVINHSTELDIHTKNQLIKELITFWINQTHDSASLISTLEIIVTTINNSRFLSGGDRNQIKVALKLAFKSASLKKIIEHRQSNVLLDILIATILSTSDWASPLATSLISKYIVSIGMAAIRAIILECNMNKLFTKLGLESNNERECNRLIDQN